MSEDMVERVARAIYADTYPHCSWPHEKPGTKNRFKRRARAAIEAMMEPTPGMVEAGGAYLDRWSPRDTDENLAAAEILQAMLRAALATPSASGSGQQARG